MSTLAAPSQIFDLKNYMQMPTMQLLISNGQINPARRKCSYAHGYITGLATRIRDPFYNALCLKFLIPILLRVYVSCFSFLSYSCCKHIHRTSEGLELVSNYWMTGIFGCSNAEGKLCKSLAIPQDCSRGMQYLVYQK